MLTNPVVVIGGLVLITVIGIGLVWRYGDPPEYRRHRKPSWLAQKLRRRPAWLREARRNARLAQWRARSRRASVVAHRLVPERPERQPRVKAAPAPRLVQEVSAPATLEWAKDPGADLDDEKLTEEKRDERTLAVFGTMNAELREEKKTGPLQLPPPPPEPEPEPLPEPDRLAYLSREEVWQGDTTGTWSAGMMAALEEGAPPDAFMGRHDTRILGKLPSTGSDTEEAPDGEEQGPHRQG